MKIKKKISIIILIILFTINVFSINTFADDVQYPALVGNLTIKEDESNGQQRIYTTESGNRYILTVSDNSVVGITSDGNIKVQYFLTNDRYSLAQNDTIKTVYCNEFTGLEGFEDLAGQHTWTTSQPSPDPKRGNNEYDWIRTTLGNYNMIEEIGLEGVGGVDDKFYKPEREEEGTVIKDNSKRELDPSLNGILNSGSQFLKEASSDATIPESAVQDISGTIYNTLLIIGIILAVLMGTALGIKFITSGLEGKAEVKQLLLPYGIGVVILLGSFTIWKIVLTILQS